MSLTKNVEFLRHLPKLNGFNGLGIYGRSLPPGSRSPLVEITHFGSNPGALKMFAFVPEHLQRAPALVVVLHGCGQTAAGYDFGTGWSTLAERYGFALLMPEQQASNNANTCFNWFNPEDTRAVAARPLDQADDCADGRRSQNRFAPHLRDRTFRGRSNDIGHAGDLSGRFCRRRRDRRLAVRRCHQCAGSAERNDAIVVRVRPANWAIWCARPRITRILAESFGVAWQRRSHGQSGQCQ